MIIQLWQKRYNHKNYGDPRHTSACTLALTESSCCHYSAADFVRGCGWPQHQVALVHTPLFLSPSPLTKVQLQLVASMLRAFLIAPRDCTLVWLLAGYMATGPLRDEAPARLLGHQASGIQHSDIRWLTGGGLPNALAGQPSVLADHGWDTRTEYRRIPNV